MKRYIVIVFMIPVLLLHAAEGAPPASNKTVVTAKQLSYDYKRSIADFDGDVVVVDPQVRLKADKMTIIFDKTNEVKSITSLGNVVIDSEDKRATCDKAVYIAKTGEVIMTGNAKLTKGEDVVTSERITFFLNDETVKAERSAGNPDGRVKFIFTPQENKENLLKPTPKNKPDKK